MNCRALETVDEQSDPGMKVQTFLKVAASGSEECNGIITFISHGSDIRAGTSRYCCIKHWLGNSRSIVYSSGHYTIKKDMIALEKVWRSFTRILFGMEVSVVRRLNSLGLFSLD